MGIFFFWGGGLLKFQIIFWGAWNSWHFWGVKSRCWARAYVCRKNESTPLGSQHTRFWYFIVEQRRLIWASTDSLEPIQMKPQTVRIYHEWALDRKNTYCVSTPSDDKWWSWRTGFFYPILTQTHACHSILHFKSWTHLRRIDLPTIINWASLFMF